MARGIAVLAAVAAAALALPSLARAQQAPAPRPQATRASPMSHRAHPPTDGPTGQALRSAHPITSGGTTGGTVNPGINGDERQHGYNG